MSVGLFFLFFGKIVEKKLERPVVIYLDDYEIQLLLPL